MAQYHSGIQQVFTAHDEVPDLFGFGTPWKDRAACAGEWLLFDLVDDALNPKGQIGAARRAENQAIIEEARQLCASCPVIEQCRDAVLTPVSPTPAVSYSLVAGVPHLTYHPGWKKAEVKRKEKRVYKLVPCEHCGREYTTNNIAQHRRAHEEPWPHGTLKGYHRHNRLKEAPCDECKTAMRNNSRRIRASHKRSMERLKRVRQEGAA